MSTLPIELKYGASETFSPGGGVTGVKSTKIAAKVKNLAAVKSVALIYTEGNGIWQEKPLAFTKTFGDHDIFERIDNTIWITRFALRYSVNGQTFWDNNSGLDHRVANPYPNTVGNNVVLSKATAKRGTQAGGGMTFTTSWVEGEIWVKNVSYHKRVGIRLSTNGWLGFADTLATYVGTVSTYQGLSQVEIWRFKTPELNLDGSQPDFVFAVFYNNQNTGEWFWDNNCGQDFRLSKADGALVE